VTRGPLVVLGDTLLDRDVSGSVSRLCPDAPVPVVEQQAERTRAGGAGLAATLAARDARQEVVLVTALGRDAAGREAATQLEAAGVAVVDVGLDGPTPEKIRMIGDGRCLLRLDRNCGEPPPAGGLTGEARGALEAAGAVLVSDYGRGLAGEPDVRAALGRLVANAPVVWDPHPRGPAPVPGCRLATPNRAEAERFSRTAGGGDGWTAVTNGARVLRAEWHAAAVAVTMGAAGALLVESDDGPPFVAPASRIADGDPCGAGDRFASAAAVLLARGALVSEAVLGAVEAATEFVAAGGARTMSAEPGPATAMPPLVRGRNAESVIRSVRARGGTVVATGGCFDLLHAGHVSLLRAARRLGDCLIVCMNSDRSVRRLKGPDRPCSTQDDRAAVLLALECVDAVAVFDEDTPEVILDRLRPDVFAKGGDYAGAELPEAAVLATWGGQAVVLPYLAGRSTTRILEAAAYDR
jgi:D-beta-D-heptose 7-phosphate kinase/D-beta-D-heptose 1-phosphate adenosyltransferase